MKLILTLAFAASISIGNAQTPLISHKSHAGSSNSYLIASSNFGQIKMEFNLENPKPYKAENFKPLNDSVVILEVTDIEQKVIKVDTLANQNKYSLLIFEFKYKDSIRKKQMEEHYKHEIEQQELLEKQQLESQEQLNQESTPVKKKKKSYLLFLFGITGGGMLLMKLFGRSRITQQSIA